MSRLQLKNRGLNTSYFKKIIMYVAGVHVCALVLLLFVAADSPLTLTLHNTKGARVICLPAFMLPKMQSQSQAITGSKKQQEVVAPQPNKKTKKSMQALRARIPQRSPTGLFSSVRKPAHKKRQFSKASDAPQKVVELEQEPEQAPEPLVEEQAQEPKAEETKPEVVPSAQSLPAEALCVGRENIIYVDKETYAVLQIAQELQHAIAQCWAPPAGIASDTNCDIQVVVNAQGKVKEIVMVKKSGVAVYDMAARTALQQAVYPKLVWGRTIVVHFDEEFTCGG